MKDLAARTLSTLCLICPLRGQENPCNLPGAIARELRTNIDIRGHWAPIGIVVLDWGSAWIGSYMIKYLLSEILGYNTTISSIQDSTIVTWRLLSGCTSGINASCGLFPIHHVGFELWSSYHNQMTEKAEVEVAVHVGSTGYAGTQGWFVFEETLNSVHEATGFSMNFYRDMNASWLNATPFFSKYTDIDTTLLAPCSRPTLYINHIDYYKTYFSWDTDGWYIDTSMGTSVVRGVCEDGYWWRSPACRANPTLCLPIVTGGTGWGIEAFISQSAAYNIPIAFATASSYANYTSIPNMYKTLLYWWIPDSTFVENRPHPVIMPPHDQSAWYKSDYRTAESAIDTWKFVAPVLQSSAGRAVDLITQLSLSDADINGMLLNQQLNGLSYAQTACAWLSSAANEMVWRTWVPDLTKCQSGFGLKTLAGEDTNNRSLAKTCDWCGLGMFSQKMTDSQGVTHVCQSCPLGQYQAQPGRTRCGICLMGTYQDTPGASACVKCDAGSVTASDQSANCTTCEAGKFAPGSGTTECLQCLHGRYSNSTGFTECLPCPVGSYAADLGLTGCVSCGLGKASPSLWATMQRSETEIVHSPWSYCAGASSNSSCGCREGAQYMSPLHAECIACEAASEIGMSCLGMGDVVIKPGFAWDGKLSVYSCGGDTKRCPGGAPGVCAPGRDSSRVACFRCLPGYSSSNTNDGTCTECGVNETAPAIVTIVVLVLVIIVMYLLMRRFKSQETDSTLVVVALCSQLATLVQQIGTIGSIAIDWVEPMPSLYKILTLFNFDLDVLRLSCLKIISRAPSSEYLLRCFIVIVCAFVIVVTHFVKSVIDRHMLWKDAHFLLNALGSLMLLFFLAIINTIVSPFQCVQHPNGRLTVHAYSDVLCWDSNDEEHARMTVIASVFILIPIGFLGVCMTAVLLYPVKMKRGEVIFLQTFRFLFLRFKPAAYWYATYLIIRNMLVALTPVVYQPAGQVFCFQIIIISGLLISMNVLPWKLRSANVLDILFQVGVLLVLCIGSFFLDAAKTDRKGFALGVCLFVISLFALIPVGLAYAAFGVVRKRQHPYMFHFFLSHHKAHAGSMARMMKQKLAEPYGKKAFLDADDLKELTLLFGYVANNTKTLVMMCTKELFFRPWCLGEIATAKDNNLDAVCVFLNGFSPLADEFVESMHAGVDLSVLAPFSISVHMVKEAVRWAMERRAVTMPTVWVERHADTLCNMLVGGRKGTIHVDTATPSKNAQCAIVVDALNPEAMSAAIVLRVMLLPKCCDQPERQPILYEDGLNTNELDMVIFACTSMCFHQPIVLSGVRASGKRSAFTLAVVCDEAFRYPGEAFWAEHEPIWKRLNLDVHDVRSHISGVFVDIAVAFLAGVETAIILLLRADEITQRVLKKTMERAKNCSGKRSGASNVIGELSRIAEQPPNHEQEVQISGAGSEHHDFSTHLF